MIIPSLLKQGDRALIIAPSGKVPANGIDKAIDTLEQWRLTTSIAEHVHSSKGVFAGDDINRLSDFQKALDNPEIKLILCARGGYGLTRIVDQLSFKSFINYPKWVVGFSDITAFHLAALKNEVASIHGPMATSFKMEESKSSIDNLHSLLFNGASEILSKKKQLKTGSAVAAIVGGNLALICESLGTFTEINTDDKILVLEDVGEYNYRIDRMLNQLDRADKLKKLKGLVIGDFSDLLNGETPFDETIYEMIYRLTNKYGFPIAISMPIGHHPQNHPFVQGAEYSLEVSNNSARLKLLTKL